MYGFQLTHCKAVDCHGKIVDLWCIERYLPFLYRHRRSVAMCSSLDKLLAPEVRAKVGIPLNQKNFMVQRYDPNCPMDLSDYIQSLTIQDKVIYR